VLSATDTTVQTALDTIDEKASKKETGDIALTLFNSANNQVAPANVTNLLFANASVRAFEVLASVYINATAPLFETFKLYGVQRAADWSLTTDPVAGDTSGYVFSITTDGQIQYTSPNSAGYVSSTIRFRAIVTNF